MRWRIYYADGTTHDGDGAPERGSTIGRGAIAIVQPDRTEGTGNVGYMILRQYDYYLWDETDGAWFGVVGPSSFEEQILDRLPVREPIRGIRVADSTYQDIVAEASEWARKVNWPPKSGSRPEETPP